MESWVRDLLPAPYAEDEDIAEWCQRVQNVLEEGHVPAGLVFPLFTSVYNEGRIGEVLKRLPIGDRNAKERIFAFLAAKLVDVNLKFKSQRNLLKAEKSSRESVEQFGHRVLNLTKKAFPTLTAEPAEEIAMNHFIKGLSPQLQGNLRIINPFDLGDAIAAATRLHESEAIPEAESELEKLRAEINRLKLDRGRNNPSALPRVMCQHCQRSGHTADKCYIRLNAARPNERPTGGAVNQQVQCYSCNQWGHMARECRNRAPNGARGNDKQRPLN
jgi:hypothetical protein